jgi:hypothetical protein
VRPIVPKIKHTDLKECFDKKKFQKTNTNFFFKASFFKLFFIFHPILLRKTKKKGNFCIFFFFWKKHGGSFRLTARITAVFLIERAHDALRYNFL